MQRIIFSTLALVLWVSFAAAQDVCAPAKVTDVTVTATGKNTAVITWTAPGDDCSTGTATTYELRYSTGTITESNYFSATLVTCDGPQAAGSSECCSVSGLNCNTTYYFALTTKDEAGNRSPLSNVSSGATKSCSSSTQVFCP